MQVDAGEGEEPLVQSHANVKLQTTTRADCISSEPR